MQTLVVIPTQAELGAFVRHFPGESLREHSPEGPVPLMATPDRRLTVALGGLGKVQFAVRCQYLLDQRIWASLICAGAAGAIVPLLHHGDVVVGTETIEHDIRKVGRPLLPRYQSSAELLAHSRLSLQGRPLSFDVHYGPIASGDEDIVDVAVAGTLATRTGAVAVAWEGAGAGAACLFAGVPFLEIRGIADSADPNAPNDFHRNLDVVMSNVATVVSVIVYSPSA